ncbi:MAG: hypothetical protein R3264_13970 [Anaerolineae bacterium]|nr:hypothetical protein [Anaerolineae bacterium]
MAAGEVGLMAWRLVRPEPDDDSRSIGAKLAAERHNLTWIGWLLAGIGMLMWHTPLFGQHLLVLLPPLILLATGFITDAAGWWRDVLRGELQGSQAGLIKRYGPVTLLSAVIVAALFNAPSIIAANQHNVDIVTGGRETEALELLRAVSTPRDFVMGDSQLLIFMAGRRTPPPLGDVALVAIKAGRQTSSRMITLTETYQAAAVVQWSLRLPWLPEYLAWVEANYLARRVWDNDHIIYFAPRFQENWAIPNEQSIQFGSKLTLRGYGVDRQADELALKVYWQADQPLETDYTVFTQLLDGTGALVAGWDSQPLGGHFPTSQWPAGEVVTDVISLPLPADLPAGDYQLITGLYPLDTLQRLSTSDGGDHQKLTTITLGQ